MTEARMIFEAIEGLERTGTVHRQYGCMMRLLIMTGARRGEIEQLQWSEIDMTRRAIVLFAEREKPTLGDVQALPCLSERIRKMSTLRDRRLHDLRQSFASFAKEFSASRQLIGKDLGHTQIKTTERYAQLRDDQLAAIVDRIGEAIESAARPAPCVLLLEHSPEKQET